jgi:glyoxylase-like metal-dependent hydrolase (beta-lactamase superfamily II)
VFDTNTYVLSDKQTESAIIFGRNDLGNWYTDAPGKVDRIVEYLKQNGIKRVEAIFYTHGHADHILDTKAYKEKLPGECKLYLGEPDLKIWFIFSLVFIFIGED